MAGSILHEKGAWTRIARRRCALLGILLALTAPITIAQEAPPEFGAAPIVAPAPDGANMPVLETEPPAQEELSAPPVTGQDEPARALPHDLSPWGMYQAADIVVKSVMVGLVMASLLCWTVWLAKSVEIMGARMRLRRDLRILTGSARFDQAETALAQRIGPGTRMLRAVRTEAEMSREAPGITSGGAGFLSRVTSHLQRIEAQTGRRLMAGTGVLATIGSVAPFVGLFGTVWGIMNSFIGISRAQTTNLAVVAPGIAEALLATALGLVAAIPAVVIYNFFARSIAAYRAQLADAAAAVERLASRDLDHGRFAPAQQQIWQAAE